MIQETEIKLDKDCLVEETEFSIYILSESITKNRVLAKFLGREVILTKNQAKILGETLPHHAAKV